MFVWLSAEVVYFIFEFRVSNAQICYLILIYIKHLCVVCAGVYAAQI